MTAVAGTVQSVSPAGVTVLAPTVDATHTLGPMETLVGGLTEGSRVLITRRDDVANTWVIIGEFANLPAPATAPRSSTLAARWKVRKATADTFVARWAVAQPSTHPVSDVFSIAYAVRRRISDTLDARWRVLPQLPAGGSITGFLALPGNQVVTVPNGIYTGGTINLNRLAGGALNGWLILVAETPGGVVIDCGPPPAYGGTAAGDLIITGAAARTAMVGFTFTKGSLQVRAPMVRTIYCERTFSYADWSSEPGFAARTNYHWGNNGEPPGNRPVFMHSDRFEDYAGTFHDCGTAMFLGYGASNTKIVGADVHTLFVANDPAIYAVIHPDCFAAVSSNNDGLTITDFHFHPGAAARTAGIQIQDGVSTINGGGPVKNIVLARGWVHGAADAGMVNDSSNNNPARQGVFGTADRVHLWGNGLTAGGAGDPAYNYIQYVDDTQINYTFGANPQPTRVNMVTSNCTQNTPQAGPDPATVWRAQPGHGPADYMTIMAAAGYP